MENIMPVSDMRYYNQNLSDVSVGSQVILTRVIERLFMRW